ncbi:MAG: aldo/keto reductase [Polyangiaceae bacterium]|nr:aldo/keto reductase [Polyangiaceae bacterium]
MAFGWEQITLGRSGLRVGRIGVSTSGGLVARDLEEALDRGINYFYWGSLRKKEFGAAMRDVARRRRKEMVIVVQSYTRAAFYMSPSVNSALGELGIDYCDLLLLGMWNDTPPERIVDAATAIVESGRAKHVMISCHQRTTFAKYIADPRYAAIMVRYNAAHPGAEKEVFPFLAARSEGPEKRPGVVSYTATRWGGLLNPKLLPEGEPAPRASDCYRFALSHPDVDVVLCGPKNRNELDEALRALDRGPMSEDELAWMKRVGKAVRAAAPSQSGNAPVMWLDKMLGAGGSSG